MNQLIQPLIDNGISSDTLYFLLIIPLIVMCGTFARHILGMKLLGMNVILGMTFVLGFLIRSKSIASASVGSIIIIFIYFLSYFIKRYINELGLHYFSRISLVVSTISIALCTITLIAGRSQTFIQYFKLYGNPTSAFAVVIAVLLSEAFASHQTQKGIRKSRVLFSYSLILSIGIGILVSYEQFEYFILDYPYIAVVFCIATILFGRYKGIRLSELYRFKNIHPDTD